MNRCNTPSGVLDRPPSGNRLFDRRLLLQRCLAVSLATLAAHDSAAASLPEMPGAADDPGSPSARNRLAESATAHGLAAWRDLHDINASFGSAWWPTSGWLPPPADGFDGVQLRLLPGAGLAAVQPGLAAPPADGLRLLLLGPLAVHGTASTVNWGPPETLDDRRCDQLLLTVRPGLGPATRSRMALFIDRDVGLLRRLRFTPDVPDVPDAPVQPDAPGAWWRTLSNRSAEVDFFDHITLHGVVWPRRFLSPSRGFWPGGKPQVVMLTGLDVNRGYGAEAISGERWGDEAAVPARALGGAGPDGINPDGARPPAPAARRG